MVQAHDVSLPEATLEDLCRRHAEYKVAEKHNDDDTQNAFIKCVFGYACLRSSSVCKWCVLPDEGWVEVFFCSTIQ